MRPWLYHTGTFSRPTCVRMSGIRIPATPAIAKRLWMSSECTYLPPQAERSG